MSTLRMHAIGMSLVLAFVAGIQAATYTITDLGSFGGSETYPYGINASGEVVGFSLTANGAQHAFLYNGSITDVNASFAVSSVALAINDTGAIAGYVGLSQPGGVVFRGFLLQGQKVSLLGFGVGDGSSAGAINASNEVAGSSNIHPGPNANNQYHAALFDGFSAVDLGTLPDSYQSVAFGINAAGKVVGDSQFKNDHSSIPLHHPVLWANGTMTDLGFLPNGNDAVAYGINSNDLVVGYSSQPGSDHACVWDLNAHTITDLGALETYSHGRAINDNGVAVGNAQISVYPYIHAFVYADGVMTDLNNLIPQDSGWTIEDATAINAAGQIAAAALGADGLIHAVRLDPH